MLLLRALTPRAVRAPSFFVPAATMAQKRAFNHGKQHFKKSKKQKGPATVSDGSNEDVLMHDVRNLLQELNIQARSTTPAEGEDALPAMHAEIDVTVNRLSSTGDGLAEKDGRVYVVPFTAPGDVVTARVYKHFDESAASLADFIAVKTPSEHRAGITPPCRYFSQCSGCQFQHLPYSFQLEHKRSVVARAFANFSGLPADQVPEVGETIASPLQYGYRTKLTPHFDGPLGGRRDRKHGAKPKWPGVPPIGYMKKGARSTMDIEDCLIGTEAVRKGMRRERARVAKEIDTYLRGATLLLRETTERVEKDAAAAEVEKDDKDSDVVIEDHGTHIYRKSCMTSGRDISTEYIDDFRLDNPAGAFFQNNNSILPHVTQYIRDQVLGASSSSSAESPKIKNMIDAYCGSGFFTVTLSKMFQRSIGIDVSGQSIEFASKNAALNNLPADSTQFIAADASALFEVVDHAKFPPDETVVIIDPSRKGCDENFVRQLLQYKPARICYVSCNVHTQARDVGWIVGGLPGARETGGQYEIESVRGFDFFPQTSHVEGVAILGRTKKAATVVEEAVAESGEKEAAVQAP